MRSRFFAIGLALISSALVACGGGGGSSGGGSIPNVTPTPSSGPTPPVLPSSMPFGGNASVTLMQPTPAPGGQTAGSFSVSLPAAHLPTGATPMGGTIAFPGQYAVVGDGENLSMMLQSRLPSGVPQLTGPRSVIGYFGLQFSPDTVALETPPSFSLAVLSADILPSTKYWLALYDPTQPSLGWQNGFEGPVSKPSGTTLNFQGGGLFDFQAGSTYWIALYAASSALAAPSPAPTNAPVSFGCTNQPFGQRRQAYSVGPRPLAGGDTVSYGGPHSVLTQTVSRVAPCPEPTATALATVDDQIVVSATTAPDNSAAFDAHSDESDAFPTSTITTATDAILGENASSEYTYGSTVTDESGDTIKTAYSSPQTLAILPEAQGNAWSDNPAGTVTETLVDGASTSRTYTLNGSYTESDHTPAGGATITVNPSGAGSYAISTQGTLTYAAPQNGGIKLTISAQGTSQSFTIPAWFNTPVTLYSDTFADGGSTSLPGWCTPAVSVSAAEQISETMNVTDPVLGYTEARTVYYYDSPIYGTVCMQISDTMNTFYDYMFDTPAAVFVSGNGAALQTDTLAETYVMNAAPTINSVTRRPGGGSTVMARSVIASIDAVRASQRAQLREQLRTFARRQTHGGTR